MTGIPPVQSALRLVIAGGGTGGHVLPALAVVEEMRNRDLQAEFLWIGSQGGIEGKEARRADIPFQAIATGKLRRYFSVETLIDSVRVQVGVAQAHWHLRRFRPDIVFSTGGFVSVPAVIAATRLAPVLTHEQTAIVGLATRINCRFAACLALSYEESRALAPAFRGKVVVTGNPVRARLAAGDGRRGLAHWGFTPDLPLLYVTGGARGASALNERLASLLPDLLSVCQIVHQTGPHTANPDAATLIARRESWPAHLRGRYRIAEFVGDELPDLYAAADLILGRAGAGTVAELAFLGKPAILIPLPGAGGDEQSHNARLLSTSGGAILLPQSEATPERLGSLLRDLLIDGDRRRQMGDAAKRLGRPDAAARLADELISLVQRTSS